MAFADWKRPGHDKLELLASQYPVYHIILYDTTSYHIRFCYKPSLVPRRVRLDYVSSHGPPKGAQAITWPSLCQILEAAPRSQ